MWASYTWATTHIGRWGAEIHQDHEDLPRIRHLWEERVHHLEEELAALTAGQAELVKAFEGEFILNPCAPKPFEPPKRKGQGPTVERARASGRKPAQQPKLKEVPFWQEEAVAETTTHSHDVKKARKSPRSPARQSGAFGGMMSRADDAYLEQEFDELNIAQLFRDPHGPLPTYPRGLKS
jgi:hypothetical protein